MTTHTPGPWEADVVGREGNQNDPWHCAVVGTAIGRHVVIADTLNCSCVFSPDDQRANARLIAAAPDLLAALQCALFDLEHTYSHVSSVSADRIKNDTIPTIKAAIAKAIETPSRDGAAAPLGGDLSDHAGQKVGAANPFRGS